MFVRPTWAEINLDHIEHNITAIRQQVPAKTRMMAVVKANAYGHGAAPIARTALHAGASYLAVASVDEGMELREQDINAPILILGYTPPEHADEAVAHDLTLTIYQEELLHALQDAAKRADKPVDVHLKIDTGMGRIGLTDSDEAVELAKKIAAASHVRLEGMYTHFATSDEADRSYTHEQIRRWTVVVNACKEAGLQIPLLHISNSAAILQYPECAGNMVRLGISMYGYYPSDEVETDVELRPALRFLSRIVHLKEVPAGTKISYGATFETQRPSRIATIPVGYADGYSRALSNQGFVLVRGKRVPVVGRVCMDQLMIDVTDVPEAQMKDEVVLYGSQGDEWVTLDEVAERISTISYEVLCALGRRVPRCYLEGGCVSETRVGTRIL